ncbi:MAG: magnesium chelatase subunit H [Crenarchaeota archaeon]|nr:magnesium chelatase subunit H [Thermoproteota archaeon]
MKILVISTRTSLGPLIDSVEKIKREHNLEIELKIYYTHELDEDEEKIRKLIEDLDNSDIVLIDVRTPSSRFIKEIEPKILEKSRIVIPLVVGSNYLLRFLKLGKLRGEDIIKRMKEQDFDTDFIDISSVEKILTMLEKISKIIPLGSLKDFNNYVKAVKYWTYGTERNLKNLIKMILREYLNIREIRYDDPIDEYPSFTIYVPENRSFIRDYSKILEKIDKNTPMIAILTFSGMHFEQCRPVAEKLYEYFKNIGLIPIILVGGGSFDLTRQVEFLREVFNIRSPDILINLQWFRINGGPYGGPSEPTWNLLSSRNVLLINGLIMYMREVSKWIRDPRGIAPIEVITGVALPEIDGAIEPIPSAGLSDDDRKSIIVIEDRVERKVRRVERWVRLRKIENSNKKIAIVVYNYPPGEDNVGSASYLDVFGSLERILKNLKERGYITDVLSKDDLVKKIVEEGRLNSPESISKRECIRLSIEEARRLIEENVPKDVIKKIEDVWGPLEKFYINVEGGYVLIPGMVLGNVFIGVQPSRGVHEDPDKVYHSKDLPPHWQYLLFYLYIRHVFKADVVVHLGTHGTLEFMPGKEVGLSSSCFPDVLIGDVPHIYVYHVTNPSEMTIAKRRGYAYTITHMTPPFTISELYGEYSELEELLHEYEEARTQDPARCETIMKLIREKCERLNIDFKDVDELHDKLFKLKRSIIPKGLHVLGETWTVDDVVEYLLLVSRYDREVPSLYRVIFENLYGINYDDVLENPHKSVNGRRLSEIYNDVENMCREIIRTLVIDGVEKALSKVPKNVRGVFREVLEYLYDIYNRIRMSDEIESLMRALNGEYITPRVAGDPIRSPEIFPTGSHGYAFDPRLIPSKAAYLRGIKIADQLIKTYYDKHGKYPETVAVVLWGFETVGTRGETIGQILHLLGVRLVRKYGPWQWDLEVIPLEELKRPRIDVLVTICGIFRDTFPNLIQLINRAVTLVAQLDEPIDKNFVRKHYLEKINELGEKALLRVFGPKEGAYNTRIVDAIETGNWRDRKDLHRLYMEDMSHAYDDQGRSSRIEDLFKHLLSRTDIISQVRYAHEYDITDLDHYYEFLGGLKMSVEELKGSRVDTYWIDTTLEKLTIKDIREAIEDSARTRLLNPRWIESMLKHGYDGCREIANRVEYVLGLAATSGEVPDWVFDKIFETYVENRDVREKFLNNNIYAYRKILEKLYEAHVRGLWKTSEEIVEKLRREAESIEKIIEERS